MYKQTGTLSSQSIGSHQDGKLLSQCLTRLRHTPFSLLVVQLAGLATFLLWDLVGYYIQHIQHIQTLELGIEPWVHFIFYANIPTPFVMTVAFGLGAGKIGDLAEKPARFLAILIAGAAISAVLINLIFVTATQGVSLQQVQQEGLLRYLVHFRVVQGVPSFLLMLLP